MNNYPDFLIYIYFDYKKHDVKIHHRSNQQTKAANRFASY